MKEIFYQILETFENDDIRKFAEEKCIPAIEPYFYEVGASSTGKYHPSYTLGPLGLAKHTVAVVRFLDHMFRPECISNFYTSRERDLLKVAALMHDSRKSGTQEDYEKSHYTKFDHPIQAANLIRSMDGLPKNEIEFIAHAIESHMGQWNSDKNHPDVVLPKPNDKYQIILHLADYLASRKDIEMKFDDLPEVRIELPDINEWRFTFGKYSGKTIPEVNEIDHGYIVWAKANMEKEPARTLLKNFEING